MPLKSGIANRNLHYTFHQQEVDAMTPSSRHQLSEFRLAGDGRSELDLQLSGKFEMKETYHGFYGVANNNQLNLRADQGILIATHLDPNAQGWYAKGIDMHSGDSTISLTSSQGNIEIQSDGCAIEVQNNVKTELLAKNITFEGGNKYGTLELTESTNRITASEKFTLNGGFNRGLVSANLNSES